MRNAEWFRVRIRNPVCISKNIENRTLNIEFMKHKTNGGPGIIVALGSPSDNAGKMARPAMDENSAFRIPHSALGKVDTVPLQMLSMPDDQEQMQPPEVGDVVNYQVTGKVTAIEGDSAIIQRQSINGQELPSEDDDEDPSSQGSDAASEDGDESAGLRDDEAGMGMLS